jgi:hypothetical protein
MTALLWRQSRERITDEVPPSPATPLWPVLAELEVYTRTRRLVGWIAPEGERTSDWMNRGHELELLGVVDAPMAGERPTLPEPDEAPRRQRISATDVVFAVPPSLPSGRHLRLHRRVIRIHFEMQDYDLHGRIHIRPGAEVGDYLLRSSRVFVPITDVELARLSEPVFSRSLPVVIVNSRHVSRLHLVEGQPTTGSISPSIALTPIVHAAPTLDTEAWPAEDLTSDDQSAASVHRALAELTEMHREGLVNAREFRAKRTEILARL